MRFGKFIGIILLMALSACAGAASPSPTPSPSPSATNSETPLPTRTISNEELTAYATYRPTLPATFTPTFTPTITLTPTITMTPPASPTRTPIPENLFCPTFDSQAFAPQGRIIGVSFDIPQDFTLYIEIMKAENREIIDTETLPNREVVTIVFDPRTLPAGDYIWRVTLEDETRTGMCPLEGNFTIVVPPTPTASPEITAEATSEATAEVTAEATVEVTAEVTSEATAEVTAEVTAEATVEATVEVTSEATAEASVKPIKTWDKKA